LYMEKRDHPRMSVKLPVKFFLAEADEDINRIVQWRKQDINALVLDVSLSGMYMMVNEKLLTGNIIRVDVSMPPKPEPLTFYAEVIWANEQGAGLRFVEMWPDDIDILKAYMEKVASLTGPS
jgi:hypothetical protein